MISRCIIAACIQLAVLGVLGVLVPPATADTSAPEYCEGFLSDACSRMRKVIETNVVPTYCKPGFAIMGSGINLDHEQLRICYVTTQNARIARKTPEEKRRETDIDAAQKRRIEDARAMVREDWETYGRQIEAVEIAYACDLIASWEAGVAISKVQGLMFNVQVQAGLIDDPTMNIKDFTKPWVDTGRDVAHDGACDQLPPASRARLRAMVSALMY